MTTNETIVLNFACKGSCDVSNFPRNKWFEACIVLTLSFNGRLIRSRFSQSPYSSGEIEAKSFIGGNILRSSFALSGRQREHCRNIQLGTGRSIHKAGDAGVAFQLTTSEKPVNNNIFSWPLSWHPWKNLCVRDKRLLRNGRVPITWKNIFQGFKIIVLWKSV